MGIICSFGAALDVRKIKISTLHTADIFKFFPQGNLDMNE